MKRRQTLLGFLGALFAAPAAAKTAVDTSKISAGAVSGGHAPGVRIVPSMPVGLYWDGPYHVGDLIYVVDRGKMYRLGHIMHGGNTTIWDPVIQLEQG